MAALNGEGATDGAPPAFELADEAGTARLAAALATRLPERALVTLSGELGAGKTVFARALLAALGHEGPVPSPTYALLESYRVGARRVAHLDLYRLGSPLELLDIGFEDIVATHDLLLLEWPERAAGLLPEPDIALRIEHAGGTRRRVRLDCGGTVLDNAVDASML